MIDPALTGSPLSRSPRNARASGAIDALERPPWRVQVHARAHKDVETGRSVREHPPPATELYKPSISVSWPEFPPEPGRRRAKSGAQTLGLAEGRRTSIVLASSGRGVDETSDVDWGATELDEDEDELLAARRVLAHGREQGDVGWAQADVDVISRDCAGQAAFTNDASDDSIARAHIMEAARAVLSGEVQALHFGRLALTALPPSLALLVADPRRTRAQAARAKSAAEAINTARAQLNFDRTILPPTSPKLSAEATALAEMTASARQAGRTERARLFAQPRFLDVSENDIEEFDGLTLGRLSPLLELHAASNRLERLPSELGRLRFMRVLDVSNNQLRALPRALGRLVMLVELRASANSITEVPTECGRCRALSTLLLDRNSLTALPASLGQISTLRQLDVRGNQIVALPPTLRRDGIPTGTAATARLIIRSSPGVRFEDEGTATATKMVGEAPEEKRRCAAALGYGYEARTEGSPGTWFAGSEDAPEDWRWR